MDQSIYDKQSSLISLNEYSQRSRSMFCFVHFVPTIRPLDNNNTPSPLSLVRSSFLDTIKDINSIQKEDDYIFDVKHTAIKQAYRNSNKENGIEVDEECRSVVKRKHSILEMLRRKRKNTMK